MDLGIILAAMGIPSAVTGFCFWYLQRRLMERDTKHDEKDELQKRYEVLQIEGLNASLNLSEATAKAIVKDEAPNDEMTQALEAVQKFRNKQTNFMRNRTAEQVHHGGVV
jgi:hypothetical protein